MHNAILTRAAFNTTATTDDILPLKSRPRADSGSESVIAVWASAMFGYTKVLTLWVA